MGTATIRNHGVTTAFNTIAEKQSSRNWSSLWIDVAIFCIKTLTSYEIGSPHGSDCLLGSWKYNNSICKPQCWSKDFGKYVKTCFSLFTRLKIFHCFGSRFYIISPLLLVLYFMRKCVYVMYSCMCPKNRWYCTTILQVSKLLNLTTFITASRVKNKLNYYYYWVQSLVNTYLPQKKV